MAKATISSFMELIRGVAGHPGLLEPEIAALNIERPEQLQIALLSQILIEMKQANGGTAAIKAVRDAIAENDRKREHAEWIKTCRTADARGLAHPPHPAELAARAARIEAKAADAKAETLAPQPAAPVAPSHPNAPADDDEPAAASDAD